MPSFSNFKRKSSRGSLYAVRSNKKCCSFSMDPKLQTLQILSCLGIPVYLSLLIVIVLALILIFRIYNSYYILNVLVFDFFDFFFVKFNLEVLRIEE